MHPFANLNLRWRSLRWRFAKLAAIATSAAICSAQPLQREWIRTYSLDATKINQASLIAIAPDGNIIVAGNSQNPAGDLDYQIIKYNPNGDELWKARYGSEIGVSDQLTAMALDPLGNIIVTGSWDTAKFNSAGSLIWSVRLGGQALIANAEFVYVTGSSSLEMATTQLENNNVDGKENWHELIYSGIRGGADIGQAITLDANGNVYVAGETTTRTDFSPRLQSP